MINKYIKNFLKGDYRTVKAKRHIIFSFFLKAVSIVVGLVLIPLILAYLDKERYGIWLTLSSIIMWVSFFDIGLGNGLRNRIVEAKVKNNDILIKTFVSTTYALVTIFFGSFLVLYFIVNTFLDWQLILNTTTVGASELKLIANIVIVFFVLRFVFKLIGTVLLADQRPAVNNAFGPIANLLSLIVIFILTKTTEGSLIYLALVLSAMPVIVLIGANVYFFNNDYNKYIPDIKYVDFSKSKDLLGLGFKFFIIQIAALIFYSSINILIAQLTSQSDVAKYNVSYKLFSIVVMINSIVLSPFWAATTDAFLQKDYQWIRNSLKKLLKVVFVLSMFLLIILFFSNDILYFWVGKKITIPFDLNVIVAIYVFIQVLTAPFSILINGFGTLKISIYSILFRIIIFFPLAIYLGERFGVIGIVTSVIIIQLIPLIVSSLQVYLILNNKIEKNSIWLK